jgi:hypothetical protein
MLGLTGGSRSRGTQRTRYLKNYGLTFDELAPHLYHGKQSAKVPGNHETPERIRDNKTQYFLLRKSNPITRDRLQPEGTTVTTNTLIDLPIETVENSLVTFSSQFQANCKAAVSRVCENIHIHIYRTLALIKYAIQEALASNDSLKQVA